jgi:hypothetical protein
MDLGSWAKFGLQTGGTGFELISFAISLRLSAYLNILMVKKKKGRFKASFLDAGDFKVWKELWPLPGGCDQDNSRRLERADFFVIDGKEGKNNPKTRKKLLPKTAELP